MKITALLLVSLVSCFLTSCSSGEKVNSDQSADGLEVIKVDLSEAREGKLSEFFEPEIEYIWLKDDSEDAQLNAELHKIIFHADRILTMDIFGCRCIKVFDRAGNFINLIKAYGEGPGKYLEFDDVTMVNDQILLTGVYPPKLMWFSMDGELLREEKFDKPIASGIYSRGDGRYFFYYRSNEPGEYLVKSFNDSFDDSLAFLPFRQGEYYGNFSNRENFRKADQIYLARSFHDTVAVFEDQSFVPKLVFDYGKYGQSIEELARNRTDLDPLARLKFINERAKLYFSTHGWYVTESWLYSGFRYEKKSYNVFFNRKNRTTSVVDWIIKDDLDEGFNPYSILYSFDENHVGNKIPGRDLFGILQKKNEELGKAGFEEYVRGKGKDFAQVAIRAKDSENPVLIVYNVKK